MISYDRNLAGEIAQEYTKRQVCISTLWICGYLHFLAKGCSMCWFCLYELLQSEEATIDDLMDLVKQIVAFHMKVQSFAWRYKFLHLLCNNAMS